MPDSPPAVDVRDLRKSFGRTVALDGLNLTVGAGEIAGFLGPNGSGKTTTLRVLLGLLRGRATTLRVLASDPWADAVELHRRVAYVPGDVNLWPNLTGGQIIDILNRLRGGVSRIRRDELVQRFDLDPTQKARTYSKGNRQKVALIAALAPHAELLVLDEPTAGLDPIMDAEFRACIKQVQADGGSVLLSSHIFAEVERLCDTVTIIRKGRTVEAGALAELRHLNRTSVSCTIDGSVDQASRIPGLNDLEIDGRRLSFTVADEEIGSVLAALAPLGPRSLVCAPPSLEEIFLRHYGTELSALDIPVS